MNYNDLESNLIGRSIRFSGKPEDWIVWEEKFKARAAGRGYLSTMLGKETIPKSAEVLTDDDTQKKEVRKANLMGYQDLIMSVDHSDSYGKIAFNIIKSSKSDDYLEGNIAIAFRKLKEKYSPKTAVVLSQLEHQFYDARMADGDDPDVMISTLEARASIKDGRNGQQDDQ